MGIFSNNLESRPRVGHLRLLPARNRRPVMLTWSGLGLTQFTHPKKNPNLRQRTKCQGEPRILVLYKYLRTAKFSGNMELRLGIFGTGPARKLWNIFQVNQSNVSLPVLLIGSYPCLGCPTKLSAKSKSTFPENLAARKSSYSGMK